MDPAAWKRLEAHVDRALELDGAERQAFLERLAADEPDLALQVERFLENAVAAQGFLETPVEQRAAALFEGLVDECSDTLGRRIGPYRVTGTLGRGGMGVVHLAERADGQFEQEVALKLVQGDLASADSLERFRNERQILARLEHPNVARLFDGGVTEAGQPYFAMERVAGQALTAHCDERRLSIEERLRLVLQVCDAVDYAHRNLVVHRDLKPSNILVTADGVAKLLDFGIAKLLDPARTGRTALTLREAHPLTVAYAAPEQFLGQPVTTATDVYSLGVLLHELLCGRLPAPVDGLARADVLRVMLQREREPISQAAARSEADAPTPAEAAAARGLPAERLPRRLRGDLDNVVGMALRVDPQRRYPSARALGDDLRRHLAGQPVSARPDTLAYRTAKFVGRHRLGVAASALLASTLAAGVVGTVWQAREALRQAKKAEEVKQFIFNVFGQSDPNVAKGQEPAARQLLAEGARRIRSELGGQPDVEAEMLLFVGEIDFRLGLAKEARPLYTRALELRRKLYGDDSAAVADAQVALASVAISEGKRDEAETLLAAALETRRKWKGEDHPDTAYVRALWGRLRFDRGDLPGAEELLRRAVEAERRHLAPPNAELASSLNALGRVLHRRGDFDGAARLYREGLDMRVQLFGSEHTHVSESQLNLAALMRDRGDLRGAVPLFRSVLELDRRLLGTTHDKLAADLNNLGLTLAYLGECREAEERLRESLQVRERLYGADDPKIAIALHGLARPVRCLGRLAEAEALSRRALGLAVAQQGDDDSANVGSVREELALTLCARGRLPEAETLARRALAAYRAKLSADHPWVSGGLVTLARVLVASHRAAEAQPLLIEALALRRAKFGEDDFRTVEARGDLQRLEAAAR